MYSFIFMSLRTPSAFFLNEEWYSKIPLYHNSYTSIIRFVFTIINYISLSYLMLLCLNSARYYICRPAFCLFVCICQVVFLGHPGISAVSLLLHVPSDHLFSLKGEVSTVSCFDKMDFLDYFMLCIVIFSVCHPLCGLLLLNLNFLCFCISLGIYKTFPFYWVHLH